MIKTENVFDNVNATSSMRIVRIVVQSGWNVLDVEHSQKILYISV